MWNLLGNGAATAGMQGAGSMLGGGISPVGQGMASLPRTAGAMQKGTGALGKGLAPFVLSGGIGNWMDGQHNLDMLNQTGSQDDVARGDAHLQRAQGIGGTVAGGIGTLGLFGSMMQMGGAGMSAVGSGLSGLMAGGTTAAAGGAGMSTGVMAAGLLPAAAAAGAGLAGGIGLANRGNNYIADTGILGKNQDGTRTEPIATGRTALRMWARLSTAASQASSVMATQRRLPAGSPRASLPWAQQPARQLPA
jgi:hypothetical protein